MSSARCRLYSSWGRSKACCKRWDDTLSVNVAWQVCNDANVIPTTETGSKFTRNMVGLRMSINHPNDPNKISPKFRSKSSMFTWNIQTSLRCSQGDELWQSTHHQKTGDELNVLTVYKDGRIFQFQKEETKCEKTCVPSFDQKGPPKLVAKRLKNDTVHMKRITFFFLM